MTLLPILKPHPANTPWPTKAWTIGDAPKSVALHALVDHAFSGERTDDLDETLALVIVQHGRLVLERYRSDVKAFDTLPSWSMGKSITQALTGILVKDGKIDIHAPAKVPEWQEAGDPRGAITLDLLLRMSSGLEFVEEYVPDKPSDVIQMLWLEGAGDVAHFAASKPLAHKPGSFWSYSSGTTNIIARALGDALGAKGEAFEGFMRQRLFGPLGMTSPIPKFDAAGTFIGSSFCYSTAQDFARFGYLYLRDGVWDGQRILPEGWVDYARTPTWQQPTEDGRYGAQWWLDIAGPGSFSANGYEGQFTAVVPDKDAVIVRLGKTTAENIPNVKRWIKSISDAL